MLVHVVGVELDGRETHDPGLTNQRTAFSWSRLVQ